MSHRLEQINEQLRGELAILISQHIPMDTAGLITIIWVKCSPDLRYAKVSISVLPENMSGSALKALKSHSSIFSNSLRKRLDLKFIPKFHWAIDDQERYAVEMDKVFREMEQEETGQ